MTDGQEKAPEEQAPVVKHSDEDYLDFLAMIAMEYEDFVEAEKVMDACHLSAENEDRQAARQAYVRAMSASRRERREQKEHHSIATWKGVHCRPTRLMAYILLFMMLIVPVAVANVSDTCYRMANLLVKTNEDQQTVEIRMEKSQNVYCNVPADWGGEYYFVKLPSKLTLVSCESFFDNHQAHYVTPDGAITTFSEYNTETESSLGIDCASTSYVDINGYQTFVTTYAEVDYTLIVWAIDDKWFSLQTYQLTNDELQEMIRNVRRISS